MLPGESSARNATGHFAILRPQPSSAHQQLASKPAGVGAGPMPTPTLSASTSGGSTVGSPTASRSDLANGGAMTPACESTFIRLNNLDIGSSGGFGSDAGADDLAFQGSVSNKKKKRGVRSMGADKSGRGLRQFSMKVCEKVESKGRTTYNEVADELVAEFTDPNSNLGSPDQQYDEKNIRRRVYDALNVLMAMDIISKDKKEIQWKGLPRTSMSDINDLKGQKMGLRSRIEKKSSYLQELQDQYIGLQNLVRRNEQQYSSGNAPSGGVALPFILVQTRPHATVEVEISEDMQLVHFDFNSTPFELHDDCYVLKEMRFCDRERLDATNSPTVNGRGELAGSVNTVLHPAAHAAGRQAGKLTSSPSHIPGILKGRAKCEPHEHL